MAVHYQPMLQLIPSIIYAVVCGALVLFRISWTLVTKGPRKFFSRKPRDARPEVLDDPDLGTHHYARLKNIRLHYVVKGSEGRPLVLLLHGFPEFWYSWRFQLKELGKYYRVIALDMRGYNESEKPRRTAEYHMEKLTADIKEFIEFVGYKTCYLVGHDWGGTVAWSFATQYPNMVAKLICCNIPNPYAMQVYMRSHPSQLLKSWYMFLFQLPKLPERFLCSQDLFFLTEAFKPVMAEKPLNFTEEDLEAFKYTYKTYADLTGPMNYYRAVIRYRMMRLPSTMIQAPTLIIWGTQDVFLEKDLVEPSTKYVNNQCTVRYIDTAGHWVQQEEPELVNKYIKEFLGYSYSR